MSRPTANPDARLRWMRCSIAALAAQLAVLGCHGERDEAQRAEAGRMARAVQALRDAPNEGKAPLLSLLEHATCSASDVCALQNGCVAAYKLQAQGLDGLAAIRRVTRVPGEPIPEDVALLLSRSEGLLTTAATLTRHCADLEAAARRHYSL